MKEKNFAAFLEAFTEQKSRPHDFVVVTLVNIKGSAPQDVGARMIVDPEGLRWGTVGGGRLEARALQEAAHLLGEPQLKPRFCEWNLQTEIGMSCGGVAQLFFEKHTCQHQWTIALFGAGHVGQALVRALLPLDVELRCYDTRAEWLAKLPESSQVHKTLSENLPAEIASLSPQTFVVIMTMGHSSDLPILEAALRKGFPYVGNLGSTQKARALRSELLDRGLSEPQTQSFYCPMGEDFGNNSPAEIAVSITAQLLRVRDQVRNT